MTSIKRRARITRPNAVPGLPKPAADAPATSTVEAPAPFGKAPPPSGPHERVDPASMHQLSKRATQVLPLATAARKGAPVPLVDVPMPDPFVWARPDGDYLVATSNAEDETFPMYRKDPATGVWARALDAAGKPMAIFGKDQMPRWISRTAPDRWAPEIHLVDGKEVALYTARHEDGDLVLASAVNENGTWVDHGPLLRMEHGVIDATLTTDPKTGELLMLYKPDNNSVGEPTPILSQKTKLTDKGLELIGQPHELMVSGPEDGGLIEGPFVVQENGTSWLFVASDNFATAAYKTWFAQVDDLQNGKAAPHEILIATGHPSLHGEWVGPGHAMLKKVDGQEGLYQLYLHVWKSGTDGTHPFDQRFMPGDDTRKVIELNVSFRDEQGRPSKPHVVTEA